MTSRSNAGQAAPTDRHRTWMLGPIQLRIHLGDMFAVHGDHVNSEDSAFVLPASANRVGGQIWRRWGEHVQRELDTQTDGEVLAPGTVLETSRPDGGLIYHAAFHLPDRWLDRDHLDDDAAEHIATIRHCVRDVLCRARARSDRPVVFPLIGCGFFGLDPGLLAYELFREIVTVAREPATPPMQVCLAVIDPELERVVLGAWARALTDEIAWPVVRQPMGLGVPMLDVFEEHKVLRASDPEMATWMLLRFGEVVATYLLAVLAAGRGDPVELLEGSRNLAFGTTCEVAGRLATAHQADAWSEFASSHFRGERRQRLVGLIQQRNHLAHGRKAPGTEQVRADLLAWLAPERWRAMAAESPGSRDRALAPWIVPGPAESGSSLGQLWCVETRRLRYVVPHTGQLFDIST